MNLHDLTIPTDSFYGGDGTLKDCGLNIPNGIISVHFRDLEDHLVKFIREADFIAGCVAWLTNQRLLEALAEPESGCAIVVQKEDFLRPDGKAGQTWRNTLRKSYDRLKCDVVRMEFDGVLGGLSYATGGEIAPVRCVGNHNAEKKPAFPRMHNKFLVSCTVEPDDDPDGVGRIVRPHKVWTGSFNFTDNATKSFENAVVIRNNVIGVSYLKEWQQIMALSEPLDWTREWCEPEWRIGS